jgi:two-component system capsular synthesis response regulator RcsB
MRILIADDHPIICVALGEMLRAAFPIPLKAVHTVEDSEALFATLAAAPFDLLILDLFMPGGVGSIPLLERVVAACPGLPVVCYTGASQPMLAQQALAAGAQGFVSKASGPEIAIEAVRAVLAGNAPFVDPRVDLSAARDHPWHSLTPGERVVIVALASGHHLHGIAIDSDRSYKTVTAHKYNALRKLKLNSKTDLKHYLSQIGLGYLLGSH